MKNDHGHTHTHSYVQGKDGLRQALIISGGFMLAEAAGGYLTNSLALMADAGHMLTDVAALALSLFAVWISSRPATPEKTYGFYRVEILAALVNGVSLVVIALLIFYHSYQRLQQPPEVLAVPMLVIAILGLMANLLCARLLYKTHCESLNVRGALLHVLGDALGSLGAVIAGVSMALWNWYLADPITSILVALLILYSSWRLLKDSVDILLEGAPAHINVDSLEKELTTVEGIASIHDLHVWTITSGLLSMSCHAVVEGDHNRQELLQRLHNILRRGFSIEHSTIQLEEVSLQHEETNTCH